MITDKIPVVVQDIATLFRNNGFEINLVGGCVRDLLMGVDPHDWDMNTNATPDEMITLCQKHHLRFSDVGLKHGTITIYIDHVGYEITTYRIDGNYSDGRHPDDVSFTKSLLEDLSRRDFTMNAIAMNPITGRIYDPFGGENAIITKYLESVGDAKNRIEEDALRMLRALRFAIKYDLSIDSLLEDAIHSLASNINNVSKERITDEFRKIFETGKPVQNVFLQFSDFISEIIPEIKPCIGFEQNNKYHKHNVYEHMLNVVDNCDPNKFEVKMAALLHDVGKPDAYTTDEDGHGHFYGHPVISAEISRKVLKNDFRLSNVETERVLELVEFHDMTITPTVKAVRRALSNHGEDFMRDWFVLKQADMDDHIYPDKTNEKYPWTVQNLIPIMDDILEQDLAFSLKDLHINGDDIMTSFNVKPGKHIGTVLNELLDLVISDTIENETEELLSTARVLLQMLKVLPYESES